MMRLCTMMLKVASIMRCRRVRALSWKAAKVLSVTAAIENTSSRPLNVYMPKPPIRTRKKYLSSRCVEKILTKKRAALTATKQPAVVAPRRKKCAEIRLAAHVKSSRVIFRFLNWKDARSKRKAIPIRVWERMNAETISPMINQFLA